MPRARNVARRGSGRSGKDGTTTSTTTSGTKPKRSVLNINADCPSDEAECIAIWRRIQEINLVEEKGEASQCFILPFFHMYRRIYEYLPLLPLATARAVGVPNNQNAPFAFKFVFCPCGLEYDVHRLLTIEPSFANGRGFLHNATKFMKDRFTQDTDLGVAVKESSSIWLLGIVKIGEEWSHQILGGVIYITSVAEENVGHASFVYYVAVQDPAHDFIESENQPQISPEHFEFDPGDDFPLLRERLTDCFGAGRDTRLGSRRIGVMLLSIVQQLSYTSDQACHLYLQSLKQTFAYRRYIRLGFKYSVLHQLEQDGSPNTSWPGCRSTNDLPPNLQAQVLECCYCCGDGEIHARLLVLTEPLHKLYPPTEMFGSPNDIAAEDKKAFFEKWRFTCMLPDPVPEMSCNYSPPDGARSLFHVFKEAFRHAPNVITEAKDWALADSAADISSAFGDEVNVVDNGVGHLIDHFQEYYEQPKLPFDSATTTAEALGSAACFWVSTVKALYGDSYAMDYMELKVNILDLLARFSQIHPRNPVRQDSRVPHGFALCEAGIREFTDDDEEASVEVDVTNLEYLRLYKYDMNDENMASSAAQQILNSHFLWQRCEKQTHLLIFTVKKRIAGTRKGKKGNRKTDYCVETMSPSMKDVVAEDDKSNAQYYAIANINDSHYINIVGKRQPISATGPAVATALPKKKREFKFLLWDGAHFFGKYGKSGKPYHLVSQSINLGDRRLCKRFKDGSWFKLQPGDSSGIENSPPGECTDMSIQYKERGKSCLASSFASALHMAGHETAAQNLQSDIHIGALAQGSNDLLCRFVNIVNNSRPRDSEGRMLHMSRDNKYDVLTGPSPASVTLEAIDGGTGHAIAIFENYIIDASWPHPLPRTIESLNWCCSPSTFFQPYRVFVLKVQVPRVKHKGI
jgi:hypothetical protein